MEEQQFMCGPSCGCDTCESRKKMKGNMMAFGYSEDAADTLANEVYPMDFSEDVVPMLMTRLKVIVGRCGDILQSVEQARATAQMTGGHVEMDAWMVDKITMAADYLSAVADNAKFGDGVDVEMNDGMPYAESKGLWANIHAKRERIKAGSGERMRKPGSKGAPSAADIKEAGADDEKK